MPRVFRKGNLSGVRDPAVKTILREIINFLQTADLGNFGDFETRENGGGLVTKDSQAAQRKWRVRVDASGETEKGGELQIDNTGAVTGARDTGAKGILIIRIDDVGR